jgi:hypothetical protein
MAIDQETLEFLETLKTPFCMRDQLDREILKTVARTTIRTKVVALYFVIFSINECTHFLLSSQDGILTIVADRFLRKCLTAKLVRNLPVL